jgi:hypothetical protein
MEVSLGKQPSALSPALKSEVAIFLFSTQVVIHETPPLRVEGAVAYLHLQMLVARIPVIAISAYRWLRQAPLQGLPVIAAKVVALAAALVPIHLMGR